VAKEELKRTTKEKQLGVDAFTGQPLGEPTESFDTHRLKPKSKGGRYTPDNTCVVDPITHMRHHGIFRERPELFERLKAQVDDRNQVLKLHTKIGNQLRAYRRRTDTLNPETAEFLSIQLDQLTSLLSKRTHALKKTVNEIAQTNPLVQAALGVHSVGFVTIAYCLVYIDLAKAKHASSLWRYTGLHTPAHARYTPGEPSGGNRSLRTALFTMANSQMKQRNKGSAYGYLYDKTRSKLDNSEKLVKTFGLHNGRHRLVEKPWKETVPNHRHMAALRVIMKHFLADYWYVGRTLLGLPTSPLYAEAVLDGPHRTIMPEERGWVYDATPVPVEAGRESVSPDDVA